MRAAALILNALVLALWVGAWATHPLAAFNVTAALAVVVVLLAASGPVIEDEERG